MRISLIVIAFIALAGTAHAQQRNQGYGSQPYGTGSNPNSNSVGGYVKDNGTYVQPHQRTNPDSSRSNNYNAPGNYNPNPPRK
jgi:hypothetical protein